MTQELITNAIKALFIENPPDEMGPSDEPDSVHRLGYNSALEDAIDAVEKALAAPAPAIADTAGAKPIGKVLSDVEIHDARIDLKGGKVIWFGTPSPGYIYASPAIDAAGASSDDVRDAARYRWIKENADVTFKESRGFISSASGRLIFSSMPAVQELDSAIDGIIDEEKRESEAKESGK